MCTQCYKSWLTALIDNSSPSGYQYQQLPNDMETLQKDAPTLDTPEDLTKCGICKGTILDPKSLPCLHTFCLSCLIEWNAGRGTAESLPCPVCHTSSPLPADGIDGLLGNVFVSSMIERR